MVNRATADNPVRWDQSRHASYRTPSRPADLAVWENRRYQMLSLLERGYDSRRIGERMNVAAVTVRHWMQRLYNELDLPPYRRSAASLIAAAYRRGWLACPCGRDSSCAAPKVEG